MLNTFFCVFTASAFSKSSALLSSIYFPSSTLSLFIWSRAASISPSLSSSSPFSSYFNSARFFFKTSSSGSSYSISSESSDSTDSSRSSSLISSSASSLSSYSSLLSSYFSKSSLVTFFDLYAMPYSSISGKMVLLFDSVGTKSLPPLLVKYSCMRSPSS